MMALSNISELCRLCLEESDMLYKLDSDFCILVMESGDSITISDALKYLSIDLKIPPLKTAEEQALLIKKEQGAEDEEKDEAEPELKSENEDQEAVPDDPQLPKSMCQACLEKLQSAFEFRYRCEDNKTFLKNYLRECADARLAEERAAKEAALRDLNVDLDNLDSLPDKLKLKVIVKEKKPRKPRDPTKIRRRKGLEKNIIIAEDSQVESPLYVRKLVTTPEQSPELSKHANKRKSKHVVIEDVFVGTKPEKKIPKIDDMVFEDDDGLLEERVPKKKKKKEVKAAEKLDEPVFEDEEQEQPVKKKRGRPKKVKEEVEEEAEEAVVKKEKPESGKKKKKAKVEKKEDDEENGDD